MRTALSRAQGGRLGAVIALVASLALAAGNAGAASPASVASSPTLTATAPAAAAAAAASLRPTGETPFWKRFEALRDRAADYSASPLSTVAGPLSSRRAGAPARTIPLPQSPYEIAIDQATHTAYVQTGGTLMSVVNTATCNAHASAGCGQPTHTVTVGPGPVAAAVDEATDTIYTVALGSNTISVINGATCNASVTSGCGQVTPTVTVAPGPDGVAVDQATDTVYVASAGPGDDNTGHTVSVINGATCNGKVHSGCDQTPATVQVGLGPVVPAVDEATDTIYVPNADPGGPGTVSVIDGRRCNGTVHTGCGATPPRIAVGFNTFPDSAAVDQATDTVYEVASGPALGRVYVINGATCNASVTSGCGQAAPTVAVGSGPTGVVVDPATDTVFVVNQEDSTVSVIDARLCNARHTAGCAHRPPVLATGFETGYLAVDIASDTVYVPSYSLNDVSVLDGASCTLSHQSGCRHDAPTTTVGVGPNGTAINKRTHTLYVANQIDKTLSVIDAASCDVPARSGCGQTWPTVTVGAFPQAVAVDERTNTVYVANDGDNTVSVIDGATCNATDHAGCATVPVTVPVGTNPDALTVDAATDTVYVANDGDKTVSVIDGATCNATTTASCHQTPTAIEVGSYPYGIAVDQRTDTVYVANVGDNTVSVIDGATCHSGITTGCGRTPPTVAAGVAPSVLAVNPVTDTVYVADLGIDNFENGPETLTSLVSVINGATCNASTTTGCGQTPATMATGGDPQEGIAVDTRDNTVYVDSLVQSDINIFHGDTCDGTHHAGCGQTPRKVLTGGWPSGIAVNETTGKVYVTDNVDGEVSIFGVGRCWRSV